MSTILSMERISKATTVFIAFLSGRCGRVPHRQVKAFVEKLNLAIIEAKLDPSCCPVQELLQVLEKQERVFTGRDGLQSIIILLKVITQLLEQISSTVDIIEKLQQERQQQLLQNVSELEALVQSIGADSEEGENLGPGSVDADWTLDDITHHPLYKHHYLATHPFSMSPVFVILWNGDIPGPHIIHNGSPVEYVSIAAGATDELQFSTGSDQTQPVEEGMIARSRDINQCIKVHYSHLFAEHSNLVAIRCGREDTSNDLCVEFVVAGKGYKPVTDLRRLPSTLDGIPTITNLEMDG